MALCEDKILKISANKDALFNADGKPQLIATDRVLGQTIPFIGEFGISTNPESFATESYRAYFSDKVRGAVLRLSRDGLTPISDIGMKDWFRDNLKLTNNIIGNYDDRNQEYNIKLELNTFPNIVTCDSGTDLDVDCCSGQGTERRWRTTWPTPNPDCGNTLPDGTISLNIAYDTTGDYDPPNWSCFRVEIWSSTPFGGEMRPDQIIYSDPNWYDAGSWSTPGGNLTVAPDEQSVALTGNDSENVTFASGLYHAKAFNNNGCQVFGMGPFRFNCSSDFSDPDNPTFADGSGDGWYGENNYPDYQGIVNTGTCGGSFDTDYDLTNKVLTFSEKVKGWVSFKSFTAMQFGMSMANNYYTFKTGDIYKHYSEDVDRNTFYNSFINSSLDVMLNDKPGLIKVFNTLNYEGSQSKVDKFTFVSGKSNQIPFQPNTDYSDQEYYNLISKAGWSVESVITDKEEGNVKEFLEKEGKWFNSIDRVVDITLDTADSGDFTFQGVGGVESITINGNEVVRGCTDPTAPSYNPAANVDDGSCGVYGCMDVKASNYNNLATIDDNSCVYPIYGCTDPTALNYNPNATEGDGSCVYQVFGCTDGSASNYNSAATIDDGSCVYPGPKFGCTDPNAANYLASNTVDDGSCIYLYDNDTPDLEFPATAAPASSLIASNTDNATAQDIQKAIDDLTVRKELKAIEESTAKSLRKY